MGDVIKKTVLGTRQINMLALQRDLSKKKNKTGLPNPAIKEIFLGSELQLGDALKRKYLFQNIFRISLTIWSETQDSDLHPILHKRELCW